MEAKIARKFGLTPYMATIRIEDVYRTALHLQHCAFTTVDAYIATKLLSARPMGRKAAHHLGEHIALHARALAAIPEPVKQALTALEATVVLCAQTPGGTRPDLTELCRGNAEAVGYLRRMLAVVLKTLGSEDLASPLDHMPGYNEDYHFIENYVDRVYRANVEQLIEMEAVDKDLLQRRIAKLLAPARA